MLARPYVKVKDAPGLDRLLGFNRAGDVRLGQDEIFVTGRVGEPTAVLVLRQGAFVHELECGQDLFRRARADALANYAIAHARTVGLRTAIFKVASTNLAMRRWVESLGAVEQEGQILYTLSPP